VGTPNFFSERAMGLSLLRLSFMSGLEASFFFLQCPKILHLFLLFLFFFIAHFLLVENTYKTPYSLKAVNQDIAS
jgi:hypothetical protein